MGDAQSAQRESKRDAGAEEDKVEDAQTKEETQDKPFKNNGEISELSGSIADVNGHCEDEIAAEATHSEDKDVSRTENLPTELENVELSKTQIPEANEEEPMEIIDMEVKQNDINESFRRFFSNIGLKLTVKRGSADTNEIATNVPDETNKDEPNRPEDEATNETKSEDVEQNTEVNKVQETFDNDSTTCPTLTDGTSEDAVENVEENITETKDQALHEVPETVMNLPIVEDAKALDDDAPKEEPESSSPSNPDEEVVSPIKKFFTTGIFSSLRKKKVAEDETADKELVDMGKKESVDEIGQTVQDQQEQTEEITPGVEAHELKDEIQPEESAQTTESSEVKSASSDQSRIIVNEPEMLTSQEKDKVQASPLKRLLSGSSFTRRSKKQKGRRSSDAKLSDSGEHIEDQLMSSTESTECQMKDKESPAPPLTTEGPVEEESAWASFKKLMTPKKRMKQPTLSNEETQIPAAVDELKPGDREQISDHSTEESKKRKDSSVSWEAVLCGSGRRRSRKTSDSEDETPQGENDKVKQDGETHSVEPQLERSNEVDDIKAGSPKQAGSPSDSDGGSTWKSFKKLVTPKRKVKDEEEGRDNIQSDSEVTQEESSFSIKKLLPGRKKRKPAEKPDQVSSDEADKEAASSDEDSQTPAVVPLSEFDTPEAEGHIETQADIESTPKVPDHILQQDQLREVTENLQTSVTEGQDSNEVLENQTSTIPAVSEEPEDSTELISKHQQLSDIPEEGIITDTMATPASVTEEAARDDTIAEDFFEITSEAITAPEPVDSTLADETEMISAVSQLSESSKTSGNTTPVPAEYDLKETEVLLQQVVETISETPDATIVCAEDLHPERIAGSVSHQILKTISKEEQTILKIHRQSDATAIRTGLKVSTLDEMDEFAASAQTECISELNEAVSTEIASEVSTEFDSAQLAEDEVHKVNISQPHESIQEFEQEESKDDNQFQMHSQSEVTESVSSEILQKGEDVPDEASLLGVHQGEEEPSETDTQDKALSTTVDETAALVIKQEVESLLEIKDEIIQHDSTAEFTEEKEQLAKADDAPENQDEHQADAAKTEYIQTSEMLESQLSTTPAEDSVQSTQKEHTEVTVDEADEELKPDAVKTDEVPAQEEDIFQSLEKQITEDDAAQEPEHEPPADTVKIDHDQVAEALDSGVDTVQVLEKEIKTTAETDKPQEQTELLTEVAEELEIVQKSTIDSGKGDVLSPEEKVKSEDHSQAETDEFKQETDSGLQNKDEQLMSASQPEHVPEAEVLDAEQAATLNSGVILEDTAAPDVNESTEETKASGELEELPLEATKTERDENKAVTETETQQSTKVVVQPDQALENENHKIEKTTDDVLLSTQVEQEDHSSQEVDKIQPIIAVHISSVNEDTSTAQILEKPVITEETPAPCVDNTVAVDEPEHEMHLSEVQVGVKEEKEGQLPQTETRTAEVECAAVPEIMAFNLKDVMAAIPDLVIKKSSIESEDIEISEVTPVPCVDNIVAQDEPKHEMYLSEVQVSTEKEKEQQFSETEVGTTQVQHAVVAEVMTCDIKEVTSAIPDIFIEQLSEVHEHMIGTGTNEQEFRETAETAPGLIEDKVTETVQEGNTVVMMHMPSVEFEDNQSIQVQIVNVDIKSAETSVDTVKAGAIQTKETVDVCHETVTTVDNLSATFKIQEEIISEEDKVTIQEVLQRIKESLPEPKPEAEVEQEVKEQPNDSTQQSEMVERKLSEEEDQKMEEDTTGFDVTSDDSKAEQEIKHDQTPDLPGTLDVSFHDDKEDSDKTKAELEKTLEGVTADHLAVKTMDEEDKEAKSTPSTQTQVATPTNTALAVPQNTGIISSLGNVESPSSLSLEFKLNIQFGQSKTPASPTSSPSPTERTEFVKSTEVSEVGIQAVEKIQVVTQTTETQGRTSLTEAAVQATEGTESVVNPESLEMALIKDQPVLMDVGIQSVETVESEEQITTEEETPCDQGAETIQPVQPTQKPEILLIQPIVSEDSVPQVEVGEQIEEECDQDVWMDAEENISNQDETEVLHAEMEESLEYHSDNDKEPKPEFQMAHTEEEESQQEMHTTDETAEIESEGEDFTVAVEDPENATTSTSTAERD